MNLVDTEIRAALDELPTLSTKVSDGLIQTGMDSADEPSVWIWSKIVSGFRQRVGPAYSGNDLGGNSANCLEDRMIDSSAERLRKHGYDSRIEPR